MLPSCLSDDRATTKDEYIPHIHEYINYPHTRCFLTTTHLIQSMLCVQEKYVMAKGIFQLEKLKLLEIVVGYTNPYSVHKYVSAG